MTLLVLQVMQGMLDGSDFDHDDPAWDALNAIAYLPIMQTLSVIDYNTTFVPNAAKTGTLANPYLYRNANMYVWAYSMSSRTAYLGATVAIAGALVVVVQFVLGLVDRRRYRSIAQLLVAALEHSPRGEFERRELYGGQMEESEMARVRFHIRDASHKTGKFTFHHRR